MGVATDKSHPKPSTTDAIDTENALEIFNQPTTESMETPPKQRRVMFGTGQSSRGKGHRLGDGSVEEEPMDIGGDKELEDDDMSYDDDDDSEVLPGPLRGLGLPPPGRPHPLARPAGRGTLPWLQLYLLVIYSVCISI